MKNILLAATKKVLSQKQTLQRIGKFQWGMLSFFSSHISLIWLRCCQSSQILIDTFTVIQKKPQPTLLATKDGLKEYMLELVVDGNLVSVWLIFDLDFSCLFYNFSHSGFLSNHPSNAYCATLIQSSLLMIFQSEPVLQMPFRKRLWSSMKLTKPWLQYVLPHSWIRHFEWFLICRIFKGKFLWSMMGGLLGAAVHILHIHPLCLFSEGWSIQLDSQEPPHCICENSWPSLRDHNRKWVSRVIDEFGFRSRVIVLLWV